MVTYGNFKAIFTSLRRRASLYKDSVKCSTFKAKIIGFFLLLNVSLRPKCQSLRQI